MTARRPTPAAAPADTAPGPVPAADWHRAISEVPLAPASGVAVLPADADLLVIAAHPDDEAIGAGRIMAGHRGRVRSLTLTAGERCHGDGAELEQTARTRLREWDQALAVLDAEPLETPRWPDGTLSDHEPEACRALAGLTEGVEAVLAPWQHDPHPDHQAAGRIATAVAGRLRVPLWSYQIWTPYRPDPAELAEHGDRLLAHPTSEDAAVRWHRALCCHRSQLTARPPASRPVVPAELISRHDLPDRQLLIRPSHARHT